jgi:O-antigen ligase
LKRIVEHPWFIFIEFSCITLAILLWSKLPGLSWQPLLIAIAPLLLRISAGRLPLVRTPFDLPIAIFLLTAALGVWAAYQPAAAWLKFGLLLTSVLFYYLLSRQTVDNLWIVAIILCLLGFGICIYFFLSNNWEVQSQKFRIISQIGIAWMRIRPNITLVGIHPNDIAGIAAMTLPFSLAVTFRFWMRKSYFRSVLFGLISCLILATILMSASRGAWMAVGASAGLYILWWAITRWLKWRTMLSQWVLFGAIVGLVICMTMGYIWLSLHQRLVQVAIGTADVFVSGSRFHVFWSAIELIKDVPFTGGGLDSFSGLYSSYIMINPNFILGYSHNLFLDAFQQQGILGGLMLIWIYFGSIFWLALKPLPDTHSYLRIAVLSSLLIIIFHGLVDDIVFRTIFTVLLFIVPGMAVGLVTSTKPKAQRVGVDQSRTFQITLPVMIAVGLIIVGLISFRRPLISAWYTDLGAVEMAKVELAGFPSGTREEGQGADYLSLAKSKFQQALTFDPANPRAHYRLGLIALQKGDFTDAVDHLEIAHRGDPYHRGTIKALGLSYLWNGEVDAAKPVLSLLPESYKEIGIYSWWWEQQNRPDLAAYAKQYLSLVESGQ